MIVEKYKWTLFYMELADKILEYKDDRKELKRLFEKSIKNNSSKVYFDNYPKRNINDIDPYIIFNFLNKTPNQEYLNLVEDFKTVFSLNSEAYKYYAGIPFLSRKYSDYLKSVTKEDIDETWLFYEAVIKYDENNLASKKLFIEYFPKMLNHKHLGLSTLTMFLYWIRPNDFISFDGNNKSVLSDNNIFSNELLEYFKLIDNKKDAQLYLEYCQLLKKEILNNNYPFKNIPELSAYAYDKEHFIPSGDDGIGGEIEMNNDFKRNLIYFGAPGTGKSFTLNKEKEKLLKGCENNFERVTFHPDYSYANFVGTYKPIVSKKKDTELISKNKESNQPEISYKFVPGPFTRVLVKALNEDKENHLLIIEEINRANVAGVFGDIFQLLDRKEGKSEFPIQTSEDMKQHLEDTLKDSTNCDYIEIPSNMYIWATMNSADQGVFFMDSAFKRRWDFEYISIDNNEDMLSKTRYSLKLDEDEIKLTWNDIRTTINDDLLRNNINEDKLLGPFFIPNNLDEDEFKEKFKNKVLMYLFEDVLKTRKKDVFSIIPKEGNIKYSDLIKGFDESGLGIFNENIKNRFLKKAGEK